MTAGKTFVRRRGTTPVPNSTVHDPRLSYAALGLLTVLLSRPEGAPSGYRDLMGRGLGKDATLAALKDLTEAGYRHQCKVSFGRGKLVTHTVVSEEPMTDREAKDWLETVALRAAESRARNDLHRRSKPAGRIMRGVSEPYRSEPDGPTHNLYEVPRTTSLRSVAQENQTRASKPEVEPCEHGEPRGSRYCPLCRSAVL